MTARTRLAALERRQPTRQHEPGSCPRPNPTTWIFPKGGRLGGDPCSWCGGEHAVEVAELIVRTREEADAAIAELCAASGVVRM
jgi:hypothetical protein